MYCWKCGAINDDNVYRCIRCGEVLRHHEAGITPAPRTSGLAIGSMVCSIAGFFLCFFVGQIIGIILGYKARKQILESSGQITGEGFATAGIIVGWVGIVKDAVIIVVWGAIAAGLLGNTPR